VTQNQQESRPRVACRSCALKAAGSTGHLSSTTSIPSWGQLTSLNYAEVLFFLLEDRFSYWGKSEASNYKAGCGNSRAIWPGTWTTDDEPGRKRRCVILALRLCGHPLGCFVTGLDWGPFTRHPGGRTYGLLRNPGLWSDIDSNRRFSHLHPPEKPGPEELGKKRQKGVYVHCRRRVPQSVEAVFDTMGCFQSHFPAP